MRSTRSIEILCLALAALVLVWSKTLLTQVWPVLSLLAAFAAAIVVFRDRRFFPHHVRTKLQIESWSMVVFITGVLWFSGKSDSPLLNLYLLPIILSALTLGRLTTLAQVAVIAICHVTLAYSTPGVEVVSMAYASRAIGENLPCSGGESGGKPAPREHRARYRRDPRKHAGIDQGDESKLLFQIFRLRKRLRGLLCRPGLA